MSMNSGTGLDEMKKELKEILGNPKEMNLGVIISEGGAYKPAIQSGTKFTNTPTRVYAGYICKPNYVYEFVVMVADVDFNVDQAAHTASLNTMTEYYNKKYEDSNIIWYSASNSELHIQVQNHIEQKIDSIADKLHVCLNTLYSESRHPKSFIEYYEVGEALETRAYSYKEPKSGIWKLRTGDDVLRPNKVYEFSYQVEKKPWYLFWAWWVKFDPDKFISEFKERIAEQVKARPEDIEVIWLYYNNETGSLKLQFIWHSKEEKMVAFPFTTLIVCSTIIAGLITAMLLVPKANLKEMKELVIEFKDIVKYVLYTIIAGGSLYVLAKVLPALIKRKAK